MTLKGCNNDISTTNNSGNGGNGGEPSQKDPGRAAGHRGNNGAARFTKRSLIVLLFVFLAMIVITVLPKMMTNKTNSSSLYSILTSNQPSQSSSSIIFISSKQGGDEQEEINVKHDVDGADDEHHDDDDDDDDGNNNKDYKQQHAACWSDSLFILSQQQGDVSSPRWFFDVLSAGHYVPSTRQKPRYDHVSCFVMKSRYNCAVPTTAQSPPDEDNSNYNRSTANANSKEAVASDYKLVLWPKNANQSLSSTGQVGGVDNTNGEDFDLSVCDLPAFIEDLGGPGGVASLILKEQMSDDDSSSPSNSNNNKSKNILTVALHGNSFLRQVWESLACSWKDQITDLLLYYQDDNLRNNSSFPNSSRVISFETREKQIQMGAWIPGLKPITDGCHVFFPRPAMKEWFHPQVTVLPPTIPGCSDDLAMVEFNHAIRFYFIMGPDKYQNLTYVYDELNLEPSDIDVLVFNNKNYSSFYPDALKQKLRPGVFDNSTMFLEMGHYFQLQKRDLNRWFGADNPGIFTPPDLHACMPGVPEDEANVLLYELLLRLLY